MVAEPGNGEAQAAEMGGTMGGQEHGDTHHGTGDTGAQGPGEGGITSDPQVRQLLQMQQQIFEATVKTLKETIMKLTEQMKEQGKEARKGVSKTGYFDKELKPKDMMGDDENYFKEYKGKMEKYFMSGNRELKELLTYATQHTEEINETSFGDLSSKMTADEWEDWDYKISSALTTLTTGSSHSLVETAKVGMEAWRLLTQRWDPKSMRKKNTIIRRIMASVRAKTPKELHNGVILLRQYCNEYSRDYGGECDEKIAKQC